MAVKIIAICIYHTCDVKFTGSMEFKTVTISNDPKYTKPVIQMGVAG